LKTAFLKKPLLPVFVIVALIIGLSVIYSTCSFADSSRPQRGSLAFGAEKQPDIKTPPQFDAFKTIFADLAEKVIPTVVQVIPTKIDTVTFASNPFYQFFGDQFGFDDFFGDGNPRSQQQRRRPPPIEKKEFRQQSLGSGVIVSKDGFILTNYHVVAGANEITVKTSGDKSYEAEIVGADSLADVAVIKIKEKVNNLPCAYLGNSDKIRPGDWSVAIGNPFSLSSSVTLGIVSALGRTAGGNDNSYQNFIQTDAAINPGNSGGALVNVNGELIGINTMIYTQSGGYMGIGFAIPINMAKKIMEDLIYDGKVSRGWLGIMIQDLDQATIEAFGLEQSTKGVLVGDVFKDQPAEKAGIKRGDIIQTIDGKPVTNPNELKNEVATIHPGLKIPVEILRAGKKSTVYVLLSGRDKGNTKELSSQDRKDSDENESGDISQSFGMKAGNITSELRDQLQLDKSIQGVVVLDVKEGSQASIAGIQPNDIIMEINRKAVTNTNGFKQLLKDTKSNDSVLFLILREGNTFYKAFKVKK
jgi:serine protease Do